MFPLCSFEEFNCEHDLHYWHHMHNNLVAYVCTKLMFVNLQAQDKGASSLETGMIIGIASLTLTIFAPAVGYFVSLIMLQA